LLALLAEGNRLNISLYLINHHDIDTYREWRFTCRLIPTCGIRRR